MWWAFWTHKSVPDPGIGDQALASTASHPASDLAPHWAALLLPGQLPRTTVENSNTHHFLGWVDTYCCSGAAKHSKVVSAADGCAGCWRRVEDGPTRAFQVRSSTADCVRHHEHEHDHRRCSNCRLSTTATRSDEGNLCIIDNSSDTTTSFDFFFLPGRANTTRLAKKRKNKTSLGVFLHQPNLPHHPPKKLPLNKY